MMRLSKKANIGLVVLFVATARLDAQNSQPTVDSTFTFLDPFLNIYLGGNATYHYILDSAAYRTNVKYDSKSWGLLQFKMDAGFSGYSVLRFSYQRSFPKGTFAEEAIKENTVSTMGLEKYTLGIKLDPIVYLLLPGESVWKDLARAAFSLRFRHMQQFTQTTATVQDESYYVTNASYWDYYKDTVYNPVLLPKNYKFVFNTKYHYDEVSLHLATIEYYKRESDIDFRVGLLATSYSRPSNTSFVTINGKPIIYECSSTSEAVFFSFENVDPGFPGFNMDAFYAYGIKNKATGSFDWQKMFGDSNIRVHNDWGEANFWINWYLKSYLFLSIGASGSFYGSSITVDQNGNKTNIRDDNTFWRVWLELSFHIQG